MKTRHALAILTNEIPPYRRPIIERLARRDDLDVTVLLSTAVEDDRPWDGTTAIPRATIRVVKNFSFVSRAARRDLSTSWISTVHIPIGLLPELIRCKPDVIISGQFGFRTVMATLYSILFRKPLILWSGDTAHRAAGISCLQRWSRKLLTKRPVAFLAYGKAAETYLVSLGVSREKIFHSVQAIDNDYWQQAVSATNPSTIREQYNLRGRVALFVGRLIQLKGLDYLLHAWALLPEQVRESNSLLIVGGGEEYEHLVTLADQLGLNTVHFAGSRKPEELPAYYAAANLFVFPTFLDIWGLVVNEAMNAGLPVLCSKYAGCAEELIVEGVNGNTFDPARPDKLAALLEHWLENGPETPDKVIQTHVVQWSFDKSEKGFLGAISCALVK